MKLVTGFHRSAKIILFIPFFYNGTIYNYQEPFNFDTTFPTTLYTNLIALIAQSCGELDQLPQMSSQHMSHMYRLHAVEQTTGRMVYALWLLGKQSIHQKFLADDVSYLHQLAYLLYRTVSGLVARQHELKEWGNCCNALLTAMCLHIKRRRLLELPTYIDTNSATP